MLGVDHDLISHFRLDALPSVHAGIDRVQERAVDGNLEIGGDPFSVEEIPFVGLLAIDWRIGGRRQEHVVECRQGQFVVDAGIVDGERGGEDFWPMTVCAEAGPMPARMAAAANAPAQAREVLWDL